MYFRQWSEAFQTTRFHLFNTTLSDDLNSRNILFTGRKHETREADLKTCQTGGKSQVLVDHFHPITIFHTSSSFNLLLGSHFRRKTAEVSPDHYTAPWLSPATSGFTLSLLSRKRSAPWPRQVGTSDFNHVSHYKANGAAATLSQAPSTSNISGGREVARWATSAVQ